MSAAEPTPQSPQAIVEKGYDVVADKYFAWATPRPTVTRNGHLNALLDRLPAGGHILELGCASGIPSTKTMLDRGFAVTGVDISAAQIELAKKHVPDATLLQGDMSQLSFDEGSFDAVVAFYALFHIPKEEQRATVARMAGWLKPGGYMLFNLQAIEGDVWRDDWMGARMFSSGLGMDGNKEMMKTVAGMRVLIDEVDVEKVGPFEERFHWVLAVREKHE